MTTAAQHRQALARFSNTALSLKASFEHVLGCRLTEAERRRLDRLHGARDVPEGAQLSFDLEPKTQEATRQ